MSTRAEELRSLLQTELGATHVEVADESHLHAGHAGARAGGGHFRAVVVSSRFRGLSPVKAQQLVYRALGDRLLPGGPVHAFAMTTMTPEQWRARTKARG